jgi:hypothetical protein
MWTGKQNALISATIIHWCERKEGQPQSTIQVKGKTIEDAESIWNTRTPSPLAGYRERVVKYLNGTKAVYSGNSHATANLARWLIDDVIKAIESGELEKGL